MTVVQKCARIMPIQHLDREISGIDTKLRRLELEWVSLSVHDERNVEDMGWNSHGLTICVKVN